MHIANTSPAADLTLFLPITGMPSGIDLHAQPSPPGHASTHSLAGGEWARIRYTALNEQPGHEMKPLLSSQNPQLPVATGHGRVPVEWQDWLHCSLNGDGQLIVAGVRQKDVLLTLFDIGLDIPIVCLPTARQPSLLACPLTIISTLQTQTAAERAADTLISIHRIRLPPLSAINHGAVSKSQT